MLRPALALARTLEKPWLPPLRRWVQGRLRRWGRRLLAPTLAAALLALGRLLLQQPVVAAAGLLLLLPTAVGLAAAAAAALERRAPLGPPPAPSLTALTAALTAALATLLAPALAAAVFGPPAEAGSGYVPPQFAPPPGPFPPPPQPQPQPPLPIFHPPNFLADPLPAAALAAHRARLERDPLLSGLISLTEWGQLTLGHGLGLTLGALLRRLSHHPDCPVRSDPFGLELHSIVHHWLRGASAPEGLLLLGASLGQSMVLTELPLNGPQTSGNPDPLVALPQQLALLLLWGLLPSLLAALLTPTAAHCRCDQLAVPASAEGDPLLLLPLWSPQLSRRLLGPSSPLGETLQRLQPRLVLDCSRSGEPRLGLWFSLGGDLPPFPSTIPIPPQSTHPP